MADFGGLGEIFDGFFNGGNNAGDKPAPVRPDYDGGCTSIGSSVR